MTVHDIGTDGEDSSGSSYFMSKLEPSPEDPGFVLCFPFGPVAGRLLPQELGVGIMLQLILMK